MFSTPLFKVTEELGQPAQDPIKKIVQIQTFGTQKVLILNLLTAARPPQWLHRIRESIYLLHLLEQLAVCESPAIL